MSMMAKWDGIKWDGIKWDGIKWDVMKLDDIKWDDIEWSDSYGVFLIVVAFILGFRNIFSRRHSEKQEPKNAGNAKEDTGQTKRVAAEAVSIASTAKTTASEAKTLASEANTTASEANAAASEANMAAMEAKTVASGAMTEAEDTKMSVEIRYTFVQDQLQLRETQTQDSLDRISKRVTESVDGLRADITRLADLIERLEENSRDTGFKLQRICESFEKFRDFSTERFNEMTLVSDLAAGDLATIRDRVTGLEAIERSPELQSELDSISSRMSKFDTLETETARLRSVVETLNARQASSALVRVTGAATQEASLLGQETSRFWAENRMGVMSRVMALRNGKVVNDGGKLELD